MAKDKAKPEVKPVEAVAVKPKKSKLIILVVVAVLLLGGGGGAAWYFMAGTSKKGNDSHQKEDKAALPIFVTLDRFTVNLQSADGTDHFLMIAVDVKVADIKMTEAVKSHMPEIRNGILLLLTSKTVEGMSTLEGKKKLSAEIVKQVNAPLHLKPGENGATDALFTEFVIQ